MELTQDPQLYRMRHSLAHVLAQAMQRYRPGALLGFGPPVDDGFYYDFILPEPISEDDLPALTKLMEEIVKERQEFHYEDLPAEEALARLRAMGEPHKEEYCRELIEKQGLETIRFYRNGPFVDMCEGPHLEHTGQLPKGCFKLHSIAGAYWRGDERNVQMTRVYGWCFKDRKQLRAYEKAREEAKKRDHRKLGKELDIYVIDAEHVGKGLPLWLPAGAVLCDELEKLAREWEFQEGYERVRTPHLTRGTLYRQSGHLDLYRESMFPGMHLPDEGGERPEDAYYLKPMNCPHHHRVFAARPRSYRDLPLRLAEYGTVYRYERSGTLQGLTRVRGMCMNDAHIYITEDQITSEFVRVMELHRRYYELFGLSGYHMRLSLWDPDDPKGKEKYVDDPENWQKTEDLVRRAMQEVGLPFVEVKGEAAFYGPKIDVQLKTVGLQEFTISTNQLDFAVPPRMGLKYVAPDGSEQVPYCIHRAPLGTHERFVSFLIEHYGGAFPTWLAPVQVRLLPIAERHLDYADKVCAALRADFVRAEVDRSSERFGKKIALGRTRKIPVLLVIGDDEVAQEAVTVNRYGIKEQRTLPVEAFRAQLAREIRARAHAKTWEDIDRLD
ncbi:MAG: threonine--tRNA ligase [Planctomycetota bacterium]|nr:MAG: threonine--tRNA ligase [Planctomycetota bacterium]